MMTTKLRQARAAVTLWYQGHTQRDQRMFVLLGLMLVCCLLFYGVWRPVQSAFASAKAAYEQQRELAIWMQSNAPAVQAAAASPAPVARTEPLPLLLTATAGEHDLTLNRLEVDKDGKATFTIEQASFNNLMEWLDSLEREHHIELLTASAAKANDNGLIDATIQLRN